MVTCVIFSLAETLMATPLGSLSMALSAADFLDLGFLSI